MKKHRNQIFPSMFAVIVLTFFSLSFLERGVSSSTPSPQGRFFRLVQNKTRSFEVAKIRQINGGEGAEVSLRNGYDKDITAYAVSANGLISLVDFLYSDVEAERKIAPGGSYASNLSFVESPDNSPATPEYVSINVLAVVFNDETQ